MSSAKQRAAVGKVRCSYNKSNRNCAASQRWLGGHVFLAGDLALHLKGSISSREQVTMEALREIAAVARQLNARPGTALAGFCAAFEVQARRARGRGPAAG